MATASISGLSSGLDTASIISQLMQLEAISQTKLKTRVTTEETSVKALQNLNTQTAALGTKASEMGAASAWSQLSATSSHEGVTVKASTQASVTSFDVTVREVAVGHGESYAATAAIDDVLVGVDAASGKRLLTIERQDGTTLSVDTGDGTLRGIVDGLNRTEEPTGLRANMLQVSPGSYRLVVDSSTTGRDSGFTLSTPDGDLLGGVDATRTRLGRDATIEVSGFTLTSSSNTFEEIMPGVSVTLGTKATAGAVSTIDIARDSATQVTAVKSLVDGLNTLLTNIATASSYDVTTSTGGVFSGDGTVRALRNALASTVDPSSSTSMAEFGLQVDRNGKLVFDEAVFTAAYAADPTKVAAAFGSENGFASRVKAVTDAASGSRDGTITSAITSRQDGIKQLNASIDDWDRRLELRRTMLERQYTALEVALSNLNSQSTWLAGQISSLSSSS